MPVNDDLLNDVADAILDGIPVDWNEVAARAAGPDRPLLDRLKILNDLAGLHRDLAVAPPKGPEAATSSEASDDAANLLGRWGHLKLLEFVGRGAFGEVYRARDLRLDRDVALKLLPLDATDTRGNSIIEEGRLLARVRHPNVVTIHGAERRGGRVGIWMEFIEGRTLEQILQQGTRFTVAETVEIGIQLCEAISAVHDAGLLHRDIKSQNVMLADSGRAVLMDFGTGREVGDKSDAALAGTPLYLAPELLAGSAPSIQSDVYSVGVVLYHLLTRSYPVRAGSLQELRRAHSRCQRAHLRSVRPDVPPRLARIIERALKPRPEDRYPSARSLAVELSGLRGGQSRAHVAYGLSVAAALVLLAWFASLSSAPWKISSPAMRSAPTPATSSAEAFRHYSFGRYHLEVLNLARMRQAEREFREAIALDPQYARAHAALGLTLLNMVWLGGRQGLDVRDLAEQSALRAIEIDESVALAHTVLASIYQYLDYAPFKAQREHLRAMELDDRDTSVLRAYSFFLLHHEAFDEALAVHRRTLDLDPASPLSTRITAEMFYVTRRYDECVAECRRASTLEPNDANLMLSIWIGRCLEQQGRQQEAVRAFEEGRAARGSPGLAERLRRAYAAGGWEGYWRERLRTDSPLKPGLGTAALHARLGNIDEAMRALQEAEATRSLGGFATYPDFDPLRTDPRFHALRVRTGLSDDVNARLAAARAAARPSPQP